MKQLTMTTKSAFQDLTTEEMTLVEQGGIISWLRDFFSDTALDERVDDSIATHTRHVERLAGVTGSMCGGNGICL